MERLIKKQQNRKQRIGRVRAVVIGTTERPRLVVHISNRHVEAQIIDDSKGQTLVHATSVGGKLSGTMSEKSAAIGTAIAKKAKSKKISKVVLDRHGKLYHGRIKALADSARKEGLEF